MEKTIGKLEELARDVKEYIRLKIESVKLMAAEKLSALIANIAAGLIVVCMLFFCFIFIGISLALLLGELTGHLWMGFGIVGFLFLLIAFISWKARRKLIRIPVMNAIIRQLFSDHE